MSPLGWSILSALAVSALSLVGVLILSVQKERLEKFLFWMVSFSAGTLMAGAFFHLLPEALEKLEAQLTFQIAMVGFVGFFLMEKIMRWHHCHKMECEAHKILGYQNLLGDAIHNFIDGLVIVSSFLVSVPLGVAITFSVMLHEIPQEIGDFSVLLYSGFSRSKAIAFNLFSALMAVVGVLIGYLVFTRTQLEVALLLPLAAGGFIYIAASDLVPELHREKDHRRAWIAFGFFLAAVFLMMLFRD